MFCVQEVYELQGQNRGKKDSHTICEDTETEDGLQG